MDNSATTKPYKQVIEVMVEAMENYYANPSAAHGLGFKAEKKINESREIIAKTLNATKEEIVFTSGGSESNNFLIRGFLSSGSHVITTRLEHPSVLNTCTGIEELGVSVTYLEVDSRGKIDLEQLRRSINKDTQIVSIMHVNNEIGVVQDLEEIGRIIKEESTRVKFHVDAVQSYGKLPIDVKKCKIDLLSASAHKIYGPKGIGFAYLRKGLNPKPLIFGGGQEKNFRSGTENLPAIVGMAEAANEINKNMHRNCEKISELKAYFVDKLKNIEGVKINSEIAKDYLPNILNASFVGVRSEVMLHSLEACGIYVSSGSACSSKNNKFSHVLKAIGLKDEEIDSAIRFSFCADNTIEEIDYVIENINRALKMLRRKRR